MRHPLRYLTLLALVFVLALSGTAHAQRYSMDMVNRQSVIPPNPNYYLTPNLSLRQYDYNTRVIGHALGSAYSSIPPYALGYNPYPQVVNYGPVFPTQYVPLY